MKIVITLLCLLILTSCDETSTPSPSYLIEKTVESSQTEQIIESGSEFKMIFPANSLAGNLDIKVKKESSYPNFSVTNTKLGNNIYKIQFKGESTFQSPAKIVIKYDGSKIPNGKTASEVVKSYIFANGSWKLADFIIDESNKQLIISISSFLNPKINKDNPLLMESEGDIIIGDGYTTTDTGQNDEFLNSLKFYEGDLAFYAEINDTQSVPYGFSYDNLKADTKGTISWGGNKFVIQESITRGMVQKVYQITGEIDMQNMIMKNVAIVCEIIGTYSDYTMREFFTATFDNIKGQKLENFDKSMWLYFDTAPFDEEIKNQEFFKNCLKTISFKHSVTDLDGKTTEQTLKNVNWYNYNNHFYLYLYQTK